MLEFQENSYSKWLISSENQKNLPSFLSQSETAKLKDADSTYNWLLFRLNRIKFDSVGLDAKCNKRIEELNGLISTKMDEMKRNAKFKLADNPLDQILLSKYRFEITQLNDISSEILRRLKEIQFALESFQYQNACKVDPLFNTEI